jgi:NAD(P)-dependent dehydrogenase (short-subunit alcohol dehydrogenase family)
LIDLLSQASGIGFSIAESFAKAGVEHLVLVQRRQEVLDKAKKTLEAHYPSTKVTTYAASVTHFDRISAILKEVGKIDVLVPNVAVSHSFVPSKDVSTADFKNTFETNVVAAFHIIKEFLALESSSPRVVINVTSAAGQMVQPGNVGYGPSKAAVNQVVQHIAAEYVGTDVTIQNFHPGAIYTPGAANLVPADALPWEDGESFLVPLLFGREAGLQLEN